MQSSALIDWLPLWSLFPLTVLVAVVAVEIGYRFAHYHQARLQEAQNEAVANLVGAMLGLLAFMLAFTFGLASSRFDDRRQVLLAEANAIDTTYLRAAMLPEPIRTDSRKLLREYVEVRLAGVQPDKLQPALLRSKELQQGLWAQAIAATEKDRSDVTALFVLSLNEVIDQHAKRVMASFRSRVPAAIWLVLYLLTILSMAAMGFHQGLISKRRSIALVALVIAFSAVMFLIADLDRPGEGVLQVSQQTMIDLKQSMAGP